MTKDDTVYLRHMKDAIDKIIRYVGAMQRDEFLKNEMVQDATIRQIEIVGEASKRLSPGFKDNHSEIPWKDIVGMRNKLIHDYMGVDIDAVWDTIEKDIIFLKTQLEAM